MDIYRASIKSKTSTNNVILALLSDLHIEASDHDRELLVYDLESAKKLGARISINGDVFDSIMPSDRKRHHNRVNNIESDDIINRSVKIAHQVLKPYADLIDVISPGNHERSVLKYHHVDIISMLIYALNCDRSSGLPPIHQGSYRGYQQYVLNFEKGKASNIFTIFRHHGKGGSAPVTGGALDLDRIRKDFDADLYWIGHKHTSIARKFSRVSISGHGKVFVKQQRAAISPGYKSKITEMNPADDGDIVDFSEQFYGIQESGAQWVLIENRTKAVGAESKGYVRGMRWSLSDSQDQLIRSLK